jgi:hypothetical protein
LLSGEASHERASLPGLHPSLRNANAAPETQAAMNGVREFVIMKQTGHKTVATLRRYIRSGEIFRENAAAGLGI